MLKNILILLTLLSFVSINETKNVLLDIKKLLKELSYQDIDDINENVYKLNTYPRYNEYKHKSSHHKPSPNLMNTQTMNLFLKPKEKFENYLRTEMDKTCKETGRCGCTGTRCGDQREEVADEIDKIIDEVDKKLTKDNERERKYLYDELRCDGNRCDVIRNPVNGVDVFILDTQDLEQPDFEDLTRNSYLANGEESIKGVTQVSNADDGVLIPSPDDLVNHYENVRGDVIKQVVEYIKKNTPIPLKHLHVKQKQLLKDLKLKYEIGLVNENELKSKIIETVFGKDSQSKIYPHYQQNDNIYVPKWHYNSLLQYKKDSLRAQKRILPMTSQQKERLVNKQAIPKIIPKLAWRRNMNHNIQQYGVPFNLEVRGLGQINP